jgi:hypothetical protein
MTTNLHEFLSMVAMVGGTTTLVVGFRYTIIVFDRKMTEHIKARQPMLEAMKARLEEGSK